MTIVDSRKRSGKRRIPAGTSNFSSNFTITARESLPLHRRKDRGRELLKGQKLESRLYAMRPIGKQSQQRGKLNAPEPTPLALIYVIFVIHPNRLYTCQQPSHGRRCSTKSKGRLKEFYPAAISVTSSVFDTVDRFRRPRFEANCSLVPIVVFTRRKPECNEKDWNNSPNHEIIHHDDGCYSQRLDVLHVM